MSKDTWRRFSDEWYKLYQVIRAGNIGTGIYYIQVHKFITPPRFKVVL